MALTPQGDASSILKSRRDQGTKGIKDAIKIKKKNNSKILAIDRTAILSKYFRLSMVNKNFI